jgi:hypothetical protein
MSLLFGTVAYRFISTVPFLALCACSSASSEEAGAGGYTSGASGEGGQSVGSGGSTQGSAGTAGAAATTGGTASGGAVGSGGSASGTGGSAGQSTVFLEIDGLVAVEAEHFSKNTESPHRAWYVTSESESPGILPDPDPNHAASASGRAYLEILPDTRVTHDDPIQDGVSFYSAPGQGPTVEYRVHFTTPGTYYVWARAFSTGSEDNGVHAGINGTWPSTSSKMQWCDGKNAWTWSSNQRDAGGSSCGQPRTITLQVPTAGEHTIAFSMREDGFELDKWLMTTDQSYLPVGAGPDERPYQP